MATVETNTNCEREERIGCSDAASDERELVQQSAKNPEAVATLYRRHYAAIASYIQRRVGRSHEAEDLIAETFMAMVRYLPKYRCRGVPFRVWLYRLATTQVNRWAKRQRRAAMRDLAAHAEHASNKSHRSASEVSPTETVRQALLALPPNFQSVLALHYMEEMSISDMAQVLNCAEGTIKSRLSRGRKMMGAHLRLRGEFQ